MLRTSVGRGCSGRQASGSGQRRISAVLLRAASPGTAATRARGSHRNSFQLRSARYESDLCGRGSLVMRRCVFLDRDGVINFKPPKGQYIRTWGEFRLIPAVVDWIRLFNALDMLVVVVTNQRGVALGQVDRAELTRIHDN